MAKKLREEVIKEHEKSLWLLDKSQKQLKNVEEMLRKAVVRLSITARRDDENLNEVLEQIKSSVKNNIDLEQLEMRLDNLFVFMNNAETDGKLSLDKEFCSCLKEGNEKVADNIKQVLIELLNNLALPEYIQIDRHAVTRILDQPIEGEEQWKAVGIEISSLINKSIKKLQEEKDELQVFIKKTTSQLESIEEYVHNSRQERIDTASESSMLKESVDENVGKIQTTVGDVSDINQLKNIVKVHLVKIRKSVEEHQAAEVERENMSKQGYAHIIGELTRTQKETLMLKEQLQESKRMMLRDPLTGLPNRLAYEERIALEINRCKRNNQNVCIAMWDLDHFKKVNDTFGHDAGDRVLRLLSKIITTRVRKVDMFARIGGEEFVLLMLDANLENALILNDQLRNSLADSSFHYDGSPCPITASVGITKIEKYDNLESVMRKADEALYKSKREGRNRCTIFTPDD